MVIQWAHDSAYRFFPLVPHADLGLTLHPFDLATSKVLALVGRVEPRDFVDALTCDSEVQPLGYLAWAACGKGPRLQPDAPSSSWPPESARYSEAEFRGLDFEGEAPDAASLARQWRVLLDTAREIVAALPADEAAARRCSRPTGFRYRGEPAALREALRRGESAVSRRPHPRRLPSNPCADWRPFSSSPGCS